MHLSSTLSNLAKHSSKFEPLMEKSSINNSISSPTISLKTESTHLWKVAGALHNPNGIFLNAKVPEEQVKVVLLWSSGAIKI